MLDRYPRILRALEEHPWAMLPSALDTMLAVVHRRVQGERLTPEEIHARVGDAKRSPLSATVTPTGVAVLPLHGVMAQRMNLFMEMSGGTSTELFGAAFDEALADQAVHAIVIDVDSPGGSVFGVEELAQRIHAARGPKPIVAIADSLAASAAFWIATQADEIVASPSAQVGSLGVFAVHQDISQAEAHEGITTTFISAGKYKTLGNEHEPLTAEAKSLLQTTVDDYYDAFVQAVARGRGVSVADVRQGYGEGRTLPARAARAAGMVDRIESLADVVKRLSSPQGRRAVQMRQSAQSAAPLATPQEPSPATGQEPTIAQLDAARLHLELTTL